LLQQGRYGYIERYGRAVDTTEARAFWSRVPFPGPGRAVVRVRQGWVEPVNLYTVVVMEPSERKSPVFSAMSRPIYALERKLRAEATDTIAEARVQRRAAEQLLAQAEKTAGIATGAERETALAEAVDAATDLAKLDVPAEPKLVVDDITPEAVATVLAEQGGRLAVLSDEGGIFAIIAGRYSGQANTGVFLKGYSGTQLRVDRSNRPSELVENPALTLGLTVQPAATEAGMIVARQTGADLRMSPPLHGVRIGVTRRSAANCYSGRTAERVNLADWGGRRHRRRVTREVSTLSHLPLCHSMPVDLRKRV